MKTVSMIFMVLVIACTCLFSSCMIMVGGYSYLESNKMEAWAEIDPEGYKKAMNEEHAARMYKPPKAATAPKPSEPDQRKSQAKKTSKAKPELKSGEYWLSTDDGADIPMAVTKAAYDRYLKFAVARDTMGTQSMINQGLVWGIPSDTKVIRISGVLTCEVRVVSGKYKGTIGWVAGDYLRRRN